MRKARQKEEASGIRIVLGRNVRELREGVDMSQETLASLCGISRGYISRIEKGRVNVTLGTIERIANVFNVEVIDLLIRY